MNIEYRTDDEEIEQEIEFEYLVFDYSKINGEEAIFNKIKMLLNFK